MSWRLRGVVEVDPAFVRFALRMLGTREGREILRAVREFERYLPWRVRQVLEESKLDGELEAKPFHEFPDPSLAKLVCDIMVESGYAEQVGDRVRILKPAGEAPPVTTAVVVDLKPVVDRVCATLPEALLTGLRLYSASAEAKEVRATFAKALDNLIYNWIREHYVKWARIPPSSLVLDVGAGTGLSSLTVLRLVPGSRVIAVDPYRENLDAAKLYAEIAGVADRLEVKVGRGEEVDKLVDMVDWAVVINVLHWCHDPQVLLHAVGRVAPRMLLVQAVMERRMNLYGVLIPYLLGSSLFPSKARLLEMLKVAGWRVERRTELPVFALVASRSASAAGG